MTETTAVATIGCLTPENELLPPSEQHAIVAKQGKSLFGVEIKVVDENGATLPRDGTSQGELLVRGQWIVSGYYKGEKSPLVDGWFPTGDIATIEPGGIMQIRDRTKDVIKTGGEWISSIDLENAAMGHPDVAMAAVIGVKHPKWEERPLLFIVRRPGKSLEKDEILSFLSERVAKWWVPDDVVFVDSLPVGGTGKVQKSRAAQAVRWCVQLRPSQARAADAGNVRATSDVCFRPGADVRAFPEPFQKRTLTSDKAEAIASRVGLDTKSPCFSNRGWSPSCRQGAGASIGRRAN